MSNKLNLTKISIGLFALVLFACPNISYADWGGRHDGGHFYRWHDHPRYGVHIGFLPAGYFRVWVGGVGYYYYDGLYYSYVGGDYVMVTPPVGAVVTTIPSDFQPVLVNGVTYYVDNGTYYLYTRNGYQIVSPPATVVQQPVTVVQSAPAAVISTPMAVVPQDSFTLNIPNNKSGYTAVVIKRSGNGYVGPQGEFYSEFPKVAQLKVMYSK